MSSEFLACLQLRGMTGLCFTPVHASRQALLQPQCLPKVKKVDVDIYLNLKHSFLKKNYCEMTICYFIITPRIAFFPPFTKD